MGNNSVIFYLIILLSRISMARSSLNEVNINRRIFKQIMFVMFLQILILFLQRALPLFKFLRAI